IFPSLLLHTTQLLKDPLFIAGLLAFMLCLTTLLTRTYGPRLACGVAAVTLLMLMLLFLVRRNVVIVMPVVGLLVLLLLVARQYLQRRLLIWNMLPVVTLLTAVLFMSSYSGHTLQIQKRFPATVGGRPKIVAAGEAQVPARIAWIASPAIEWNSNSVVGRYGAAADTLARRISGMRSRFVATYPDAGSTLDVGAEFRSARRLLEYLPRAVAIGLWAPFPDQWAIAGRRVGNAGRLLSALETFVIYLCQLFVLLAIARDPRRPALWFLAVVAVLGVAALAVVIPNVGALYRFRYTFWILMIVVAMVFVDHLLSIVALRKRSSPQVLAPAPSSYEQAT
ncbi:MAG TPA: hypothetical protein VJT50_02480, partial [Pyrinomonadaceae bacterium]|nr:hypothetical protein [Pyrinomonadaceae bacterium]